MIERKRTAIVIGGDEVRAKDEVDQIRWLVALRDFQHNTRQSRVQKDITITDYDDDDRPRGSKMWRTEGSYEVINV